MPPTVPPGAVLYLRVSSADQVKNLSLDTQERLCRDYCGREGWRVVRVFRDEGESAKTTDRTALQELRAFAKRATGILYVVMYDVNRFARDLWDYANLKVELRACGIELRYATRAVDDTPEGILTEGIDALFAHYDNAKRSKRTRDGMIEAARRGRWLARAPVGYRNAPRSADGRSNGLELDPDVAPFVRRAFATVASGATVRAAHAALVADGFRYAGRPIRYETFRRMLHHPIYAGRLECSSLGVTSTSAAPAIVDETTWLRAQRAIGRLGGEPYRRRPEASGDFPLRGVVRCQCGRRLVAYKARGKTGRRWPYYRCLGCNRNVSAARVEQAWSDLLGRLAVPEAVLTLIDRMISRKLDERAASLESRLARARQRLGQAEARLERLLGMRIDGELSPEEYATARVRVVADRDAARLELAELTEPRSATSEAASTWIRRALTQPLRLWIELSPERRAVFAERVFPEGVKLDESGALSNPANCLLALPLELATVTDTPLVGLEGASANPSAAILPWRAAWVETFERVAA